MKVWFLISGQWENGRGLTSNTLTGTATETDPQELYDAIVRYFRKITGAPQATTILAYVVRENR